MVITNQTKHTTLADQCAVADTFFSRLKGLMGAPALQPGQGLLLKNEKSIHTFFMAFPLDVIYIDRTLTVIKCDENMPPNRIGRYVAQAAYILELPVGVIQKTSTTFGDCLLFETP